MCLDASRYAQTKFLRLREPASLGDRIDNWRVSWLGGWDKCRVFFVVMVEREQEQPAELSDPKDAISESVAIQ
jgi:hypothetical protein